MSAPSTNPSATSPNPASPRARRARRSQRSFRRTAAAFAVSVGAAAALLTAAPAAEAAPAPGPYPAAPFFSTQCHGLSLWGVSGFLETSGSKTKTAPSVVMRAPDGTLYTLVGNRSSSSRFNGVYYSGRYTYDETYYAPDGSVWGTFKGTQLLNMYGIPYGPKFGTCNNPI